MLTGVPHNSDADGFDTFAELIRIVSEAKADADLAEIRDDLAAIEALVAAREVEYVVKLEQLMRQEGEPNRMRRNLEFAAEMAARTQALYGRPFAPQDVVQRVIDIAKISTIAFALRDMIVGEVREKCGAFAQHGNSVWDEQVLCSTSTYSAVGGKRVLLVTEELRLRAAAAHAGAGDLVCSLRDYEALVSTN